MIVSALIASWRIADNSNFDDRSGLASTGGAVGRWCGLGATASIVFRVVVS